MPSFQHNQSVLHPPAQTSRQQIHHPHNPIPVNDMEFQSMPNNFQSSDLLCYDEGSQVSHYPQQYCLLDSSATAYSDLAHNSPSTISFSSTSASPISQPDCHSDHRSGSPISCSCISDDPIYLQHKLRELESMMLGSEPDIIEFSGSNCKDLNSFELEKWKVLMDIPRGDLRQMLIACARAVYDHNMPLVDLLMAELRQRVSVLGDPVQRLGAYLLEGLSARLASSGSSIYKALRCKEPASSELLSYMHILYEVCPYFKFGYMSANGAIDEAVKGEDRIHIIDFQIAMGTQWVTLIQALSARPGGPPHLRITGIDDPVSEYARGGGLHIIGQRLSRFAASCNVPFEFHAAAISGCEVEVEDLRVKPGEVLAVNFAFQLHHMPDESVSTLNHRDRLIRMVRSLNPTVVTLVEQESNTNTAPFVPRFVETLHYYTAVFESIDATPLPRDDKERINVEQHCLARDIVNIIACEGAERIERHELLGKWRSRFTMAGFKPYPLSPLVNATIKSLLGNYNENFRLEERDGALYLGWKNRALVVSCAWR